MTDSPTYYHGTKADFEAGDLIEPGYASNYGTRRQAKFVYLSATLDAAVWGAELAVGTGQGRIYIVEPTGPIGTTRTSRTSDLPEIPRSRIARSIRSASSAR
jgi:rifampin ADP-ribosylating transferase